MIEKAVAVIYAGCMYKDVFSPRLYVLFEIFQIRQCVYEWLFWHGRAVQRQMGLPEASHPLNPRSSIITLLIPAASLVSDR